MHCSPGLCTITNVGKDLSGHQVESWMLVSQQLWGTFETWEEGRKVWMS